MKRMAFFLIALTAISVLSGCNARTNNGLVSPGVTNYASPSVTTYVSPKVKTSATPGTTPNASPNVTPNVRSNTGTVR